jgi:hypothetical protein
VIRSNYGERALFLCPLTGTYLAYAVDEDETSSSGPSLRSTVPKQLGTADRLVGMFDTRATVARYDLSRITGSSEPYVEIECMEFLRCVYLLIAKMCHTFRLDVLYKNFKSDVIPQLDKYTQSDPLDLVDSDYCYTWNYRAVTKSKGQYCQ